MDIKAIVAASIGAPSLSESALTEYRAAAYQAHDVLAAGPATADDVMAADQLAIAVGRLNTEIDRRQNGGAIAASAGRAGAMTRRRGPVRPSPEAAPRTGGVKFVAGYGGVGVPAGTPLTSKLQLAELTAECLERMAGTRDRPRREIVARADWRDAYPDERRLGATGFANTEKIAAVCSPQAVVASGGVCLPVNVDYSVPTWAGATRPLRDALPGFQADRGGLRFVSPPDIGVPSLQATPPSGLGSATSVWTEATDANPAGATKPVYVVSCGSEQLVYVNAIPTRLQFGNMQGRFAPEQIAANTEVAVAVAAREAELELLTLMYGSSKQIKAPSTPYLGAAHDLLSAADLLAAKYRYSHRIPETTRLTAVLPAWARSLMRSDLARELAHDNTSGRDVMAIADDLVGEWFAVRGINLVWTMDGLKGGTYGTGGTALANQFFPLAGTTATTAAWPNVSSGKVQIGWLLYPEGSYQFLDGGRLTLGVVRDSTLDATNSYETFVETFEGVAFRGIESYQVLSYVKPTGGSAGTVAAATYHE